MRMRRAEPFSTAGWVQSLERSLDELVSVDVDIFAIGCVHLPPTLPCGCGHNFLHNKNNYYYYLVLSTSNIH
jgi:hypothetical protein